VTTACLTPAPTQGLRLIAKEDGLAACMKGLSPRFTRVAMAQAITFTVYETFLSWIAAPSAQVHAVLTPF